MGEVAASRDALAALLTALLRANLINPHRTDRSHLSLLISGLNDMFGRACQCRREVFGEAYLSHPPLRSDRSAAPRVDC